MKLAAAFVLLLLQATTSAAPVAATAILPSGAEFRLELAVHPEDKRIGYMFREHVGPREGMLFFFDRDGQHGFWMKNCRVSLDIIWLDETFTVVQIAHDQQPCPDEGPCPRLTPLKISRYVLELAGGMAVKQGLEAGQRVVVILDSEP